MPTFYHFSKQKILIRRRRKTKSVEINERCWNDWVRLWRQFRFMNQHQQSIKKKPSTWIQNYIISHREFVHRWQSAQSCHWCAENGTHLEKLNIEWMDVYIFRSVTTWNISFGFENMFQIAAPLKLFLHWILNDVYFSSMKRNRQSHIILANEKWKSLLKF